MSKTLIALLLDLHRIQTMLDRIFEDLINQVTATTNKNRRFAKHQAYRKAEQGLERVNRMLKQVEETYENEFRKMKR